MWSCVSLGKPKSMCCSPFWIEDTASSFTALFIEAKWFKDKAHIWVPSCIPRHQVNPPVGLTVSFFGNDESLSLHYLDMIEVVKPKFCSLWFLSVSLCLSLTLSLSLPLSLSLSLSLSFSFSLSLSLSSLKQLLFTVHQEFDKMFQFLLCSSFPELKQIHLLQQC